jgi:hypothetical protein
MTKSLEILAHYEKGWRAFGRKEKVLTEFYDTIINDIAEDIEIRGRLTKKNLIEVIGYLSARNNVQNDTFVEFKTKLILLLMRELTGKGTA